MAKTLIGNVKGKDGRGISKIEKTATTGVVDTYTITYTDGTQSTYELKNSNDIAIQRQIVPSAAVESSTTASQTYAAGDYVVVNGVLRKVTASITSGSTIGDSNSTATTVTGELASATAASYSELALGAAMMSTGSVHCERLGRLVLLRVEGVKFLASHENGQNNDVVIATGVPKAQNGNPAFMLSSNSDSIRVIVSIEGTLVLHWSPAKASLEYNGFVAYVAQA